MHSPAEPTANQQIHSQTQPKFVPQTQQHVQPQGDGQSLAEKSIKRTYRRRYACSACSSTNNNYNHMINHVNNTHPPGDGAKLVVNNVFYGDDKRHRSIVTNLINEKLAQEYQITRTVQPVQNAKSEDSEDEQSEATEPLTKRNLNKTNNSIIQQKEDCSNEHNSTDSESQPAFKSTERPFKSNISNKLARLIEKQSLVIDENVQQFKEKSISLDKKMTNMSSHVNNVSTRLEYMDNRLQGIEQKLSKLMRLIGNQ